MIVCPGSAVGGASVSSRAWISTGAYRSGIHALHMAMYCSRFSSSDGETAPSTMTSRCHCIMGKIKETTNGSAHGVIASRHSTGRRHQRR
jgi:hypothetical protein